MYYLVNDRMYFLRSDSYLLVGISSTNQILIDCLPEGSTWGVVYENIFNDDELRNLKWFILVWWSSTLFFKEQCNKYQSLRNEVKIQLMKVKWCY